jgi:hypothetical protein
MTIKHAMRQGHALKKQTTPEIPEVTCARVTVMDYLHQMPLIWIISLGRDIMASLLSLVTLTQKLSYQW